MIRPMSGVNANIAAFCATPIAASAAVVPMGSVDPYRLTTWFSTMPTNMEATCITNDAMPIVRIFPMSFTSGTQQRRRSLKAAFLLMVKCQTTGTMPHAWPRIVADALPATPNPSTMTNR